jgi:hypothetical protein
MEQVKVIDGVTVVFTKINNTKLTQPFYVISKFFKKQDLDADLEEVLIDFITSENFEGVKAALFSGILLEGYGRATDADAMDAVMEEKGLTFEALLFSEAVMNYLGKFFKKIGEAGSLNQSKMDTKEKMT